MKINKNISFFNQAHYGFIKQKYEQLKHEMAELCDKNIELQRTIQQKGNNNYNIS